jgi:RimJ/RimL family protein N-acetyltransferase
MAAILDKGRARGATRANIGVLIGNDKAQQAYEKNGFEVVEEIRDADFEREYGCAGMRELTRTI